MNDTYDVIIIGMGPAGEVAADRLVKGGKRLAVVEAELIGGECAYWACIPSKTLLRATEVQAEADRAAGVTGTGPDWPGLRDYRDYMVRHLDDSSQVSGYEERGVTVIRGDARLDGPGRVVVGERVLTAEHIIIATGSSALRPPIDGLDTVPVWTNREATNLQEIPGRALILGGGAVGVELGTLLVRMGSQITLVQRGDRLLNREDPRVGELAAAALVTAGVSIHTGRRAVTAARDGQDTVVTLDDGTQLRTDVIILGTGRRPRTDGLGLDSAGVTLDERGAAVVDESCRAAPGIWAIGDVNAIMTFTHVGMYQGRVVADTILGHTRTANYEGIPRVVFGQPEIAAVGLTADQARAAGHTVLTSELDLAATLARPRTDEKEPSGILDPVADADSELLLGAWAVGPMAGEWIRQAAQAIRVHIPRALAAGLRGAISDLQ
jgi:pyruvate/2-oxoglutarate dehydrogenase complex dihydrolipoamide dehydrogenase (E3) component